MSPGARTHRRRLLGTQLAKDRGHLNEILPQGLWREVSRDTMKLCGDSQDTIQPHPGANVYEIDFRAGGGPLKRGEKKSRVCPLSVSAA